MSGRLVAAIITMPTLVSKPSISASIWLSVCSRSSCPPPRPAPRLRPMESISSTKTMAGGCLRAVWKRSRTRLPAAADRHEGHAALPRHGPCDQRLSGPGGADQQDALGDLRPDLLEARRGLQ